MQIDGREIGNGNAPYIVAELSGNHNGDIERAKELIRAAKEAGADAVKLQTYTPAELTSPKHTELWNLYDKLQTPREWHEELFDYARDQGITIFSSAFSVEGVKFLNELGSPAIKIASAEWADRDLIHEAMDTGRPVIISTGMVDGIDDPRLFPSSNVVWLHCVSNYPANVEDANLRVIRSLRFISQFVGLSDHTPGYETAIAATALGAVMIEKHFKLDDNCVDAEFSLNPRQFKEMCIAVRAIHKGMGDGVLRPTCEGRKR